MNRTEMLLMIAAEECAEVAQRCSKAARFGMLQTQPGQPLNNRQRIEQEMMDLIGTLEMMDIYFSDGSTVVENAILARRERIEKYLQFSRECGTLQEETRGE